MRVQSSTTMIKLVLRLWPFPRAGRRQRIRTGACSSVHGRSARSSLELTLRGSGLHSICTFLTNFPLWDTLRKMDPVMLLYLWRAGIKEMGYGWLLDIYTCPIYACDAFDFKCCELGWNRRIVLAVKLSQSDWNWDWDWELCKSLLSHCPNWDKTMIEGLWMGLGLGLSFYSK